MPGDGLAFAAVGGQYYFIRLFGDFLNKATCFLALTGTMYLGSKSFHVYTQVAFRQFRTWPKDVPL